MASSLSNLFPLPDEAKTLSVFLGRWEIEGSLTYHGRQFALKGSGVFEPAAGGWGVAVSTSMELAGLGTHEEADLLCFSMDDGLFHLFAVTNTGSSYDHKGGWTDPKTMRVSYEGKQGLGDYEEVLTLRVVGPGALEVEEVGSLDGKPVTRIRAVLKRASAARPRRSDRPSTSGLGGRSGRTSSRPKSRPNQPAHRL